VAALRLLAMANPFDGRPASANTCSALTYAVWIVISLFGLLCAWVLDNPAYILVNLLCLVIFVTRTIQACTATAADAPGSALIAQQSPMPINAYQQTPMQQHQQQYQQVMAMPINGMQQGGAGDYAPPVMSQPGQHQNDYPALVVMANPIDQGVAVSGLTSFQGGDGSTGATATTLAGMLAAVKLEQYADALRELGCVDAQDLQGMDEADFMEIGMKKIEIKRLQRNL